MWVLWLVMAFYTEKLEVNDFATLPDDIYNPNSMYVDVSSGELLVLDAKSGRVAVLNLETRNSRIFGQKGQGPGELNRPLSISANESKIFIGDMMKIHVYNKKTHKFEYAIPVFNNSRSLAVAKETIYAMMARYPSDGFTGRIFNHEGQMVKSFYNYSAPDGFTEDKDAFTRGYLTISGDKIFVLNYIDYDIQIFDLNGLFLKKIPVKKSTNYKDPVSSKGYNKKAGKIAVDKWRSQFSNPLSISVDVGGNIWICFYEYTSDLLSKKYFIDGYDKNFKKIVNYQHLPGPIYTAYKGPIGHRADDELSDENLTLYEVGIKK